MQLASLKDINANQPFEEIDVLGENPKSLFELGKNLAVFARDNEGIGLAAPQVGIWRKAMVFLDGGGNFVMAFNPRYVKTGSRKKFREACLSVPGEEVVMKRAKHIRATFWTMSEDHKPIEVTWNLSGASAIIFQHECDHLQGRILGRPIADHMEEHLV